MEKPHNQKTALALKAIINYLNNIKGLDTHLPALISSVIYNKIEKLNLLPIRYTLTGTKPCTMTDFEVSFPWLSEPKLDIFLAPPQPSASPKGLVHKFSHFSWLKTFVGHKDPDTISDPASISCISIYSDYFLTGSSDRLIKIWNSYTGLLQYSFHGHQGKISCITVKSDTVFSLCPKKLIIWHFLTGTAISEIAVESQPLSLFIISNSSFLTSTRTGRISLFDLESENFEPAVLEINSISALALTPDSKYLITAGQDRLKIWDLVDFSVTYEYLTRDTISQIKFSDLNCLIATGGKDFCLWRFSEDLIMDYWQNGSSPLESSCFSHSGSGQMDWCGINFIFTIDKKEGFSEVLCRAPDFLQKSQSNSVIQVLSANEEESVLATGEKSGVVIIWTVPELEQVFYFQETGNLSLLHGFEISITQLVWTDNKLISGSSKGTHSFFGLFSNEDLVTSPIQQFYSIDYLSEFTQNITLCDFKLNPYKFQPGLSLFYLRKGYKNKKSFRSDLYKYFKAQEHLALNSFFFEEDIIIPSDSEESAGVNSVHSLLELNSDILCFRCQKAMLESNKWCFECGKTFHSACFDLFKSLSDEFSCLLCFKKQFNCREVKVSQRAEVQQFDPQPSDPQTGDKVVFIYQAYEEYLKVNREVPILDQEILSFIKPTLMQVLKIEYLWPAKGSSLVSDRICLKLHLSVLGTDLKTFVYLIGNSEKFLINWNEYLEKLKSLQEDPGQVWIAQEDQLDLKNINLVCPVEEEFQESPWRSLVLDIGRISFWDSGIFNYEGASFVKKNGLTRHVQLNNILTEPGKYYKSIIPYPLSLRAIQNRLENGFYRSKSAALFDLQVLGGNLEEVFGSSSAEYREYFKVLDLLKNEIIGNLQEPKDCSPSEIRNEFEVYLPENCESVLNVIEVSDGNCRKLRRLN